MESLCCGTLIQGQVRTFFPPSHAASAAPFSLAATELGCKAGLTLSTLFMVIGTTMMALMPGYGTTGVAARPQSL